MKTILFSLPNISIHSFIHSLDFPGGSDCKESACNAGDLGSIPGSGRSPGGGRGNPLQHSCLENPVDRGATVHGVPKSRTRLSHSHYLPPSISMHSFILHSYLLEACYPQGREGSRCGRCQHLGRPGKLSGEEHTNRILQGEQERVCKCRKDCVRSWGPRHRARKRLSVLALNSEHPGLAQVKVSPPTIYSWNWRREALKGTGCDSRDNVYF